MVLGTIHHHVQVEGAVPVRADVYPAQVQFSFTDNPYPKTRAILTADTVLILVEATGGPAVLYEERLENVAIPDREHIIATTVDGDVTISRGSGCGCGSTLKSYRPFGRSIHMAKLPR